jgi:hypothetical protein
VGQFQRSVIARGFLCEGADRICHAAQLEDLREVVQHFYPERDLPTNKLEYRDKVRSFADVAEDPWFNQEGGLRSIAALVKKIPVGDHVLLARESGCEDPWDDAMTERERNAVDYWRRKRDIMGFLLQSGTLPPLRERRNSVLARADGRSSKTQRHSSTEEDI